MSDTPSPAVPGESEERRRHFVPWGSNTAPCGYVDPPGDRDLHPVTDRWRDTTCPPCMVREPTQHFDAWEREASS